MAKYTFTATHGVSFGEHEGGDAEKPFQTWASFSEDREAQTPDGQRVYKFETDDAKVAERLRKVDDYGIEEVKGNDDDAESEFASMSPKELKAEIERRNADRVEADQIKPKSQSKADLVAALDADGLV